MKIIYKNKAETPLEAINKTFPGVNPKTYVGRLDPMAEGLLLVLLEEECVNAKKYFNLPKTYEYDVIFGITTDTLDPLGGILKVDIDNLNTDNIKIPLGNKEYEYPLYSSKTIDGKPLWLYARKGEKIARPTYNADIKTHELISKKVILGEDFARDQIEIIEKIKGDFRQKLIIKGWNEFIKDYGNINFPIMSLKIEISGGGYVRSIAEKLGEQIKTGGLAFNIKRVAIGEFTKTN